MKKIKNWIFKSKVDLSKKWWHRLFKVLFIIAIMFASISAISVLSDSYSFITHKWRYVESLSNRLSKAPYSEKVVSISELYDDHEVISEEKYPSKFNNSLNDKHYLFPFSTMFMEDIQSNSFCSNELDKHIKDIAQNTNTKLFSPVNYTFEKLSTDIDNFVTYLKNNSYSIKCVTFDSYTIDNENNTTSTYKFIKPVDTSKYYIYEYKNNFSGFILAVLLTIVTLPFFVLCTILIYYKVVLYIVYGKPEESSSI